MPKKSNMNRRQFLGYSATGLTTVCALSGLTSCSKDKESRREKPFSGQKEQQQLSPPVDQSPTGKTSMMPSRVLGKTGLRVSALSFGGGSQFLENKDGIWEPLLERAIKLGVNLFDTSSGYQWKASLSSEERFGRILPPYREKIILSTKCDSRDVETARLNFERSLKCMRTDYVDILMIHSIEANEDLAALEKGVYRFAVRQKEQGTARFIGFSSMNSAEKSKAMIDAFDLDVCLLAMNPTKYGDFVKLALPSAREKNLGILAMKVMRNLVGKDNTTPQELLGYALDQQGVASAVVGHIGPDTLESNARLIRKMPLSNSQPRRNTLLEKRLSRYAGAKHLCWACPGYTDSYC